MPTRRARLLALACALLALLWPVAARSTSVEALDEAAVVRRSATVLWGDCTSVQAEWDAGRTRIFTRARFVPREVLKGDPQLSAVELLLPGGELDGKAYVVHGMPRFRPGEELLLCASARHEVSGVTVPVGLSQGVWRVQRAAGAPGLARRDTRELQLQEPGVRGGRPGAVEEGPLDALLERLRAEVRRQREEAR
jgi:hypothetical protein